MKNTRLILPVILSAMLMGNINCDNKPTTTKSQEKAADTSEKSKKKLDAFAEIRDSALKMTPEKLGISLSTDKTVVFGVVTDIYNKEGLGTLICFQTGDASVYMSSGGAVIGGIEHEDVSDESKALVKHAQAFLEKTTKTEHTPYPTEEGIQFYLITNKGIFAGWNSYKELMTQNSTFYPLFVDAYKVMNQLMLLPEKK